VKSIVSYWDGHLNWLERLCLTSARAVGHKVALYTSQVKRLRAEGVADEVHDIREIMDPGSIESLYLRSGHLQLFSDIVRLRLQKLGLGIWADCDCLFLAPVGIRNQEKLNQLNDKAPDSLLLGWYPTGRVGNSVMYMDPKLPLLTHYYSAVTQNPLNVPWATKRVQIWRHLEIVFGRALPSNPGRMAIGPRALTHFVCKHQLQARILPASVFYPVAQADCIELVNPDDRIVRNMICGDSLMIHAWHTNLYNAGALQDLPPATSLLGQYYKKLCR
jgi:hypothetical protein